jgi:hypothetical protein
VSRYPCSYVFDEKNKKVRNKIRSNRISNFVTGNPRHRKAMDSSTHNERKVITLMKERSSVMKKTKVLALAMLAAFTLSACAGNSVLAKKEQIDCPACGYEFEPPMGGG